MKILIVSDTHRRDENFLRVMDQVRPVDMVVHCGDVEGSERLIEEAAGCPVKMVRGNNDFLSPVPREAEFMIGDYRVCLTPGHNYCVYMNYETINQEAIYREEEIVM